MREEKKLIHSQSATRNNKGMVGMYCLLFFSIVIFYGSMILANLNKYIYFRNHLDKFRRLNNAEVLAIMRIKNMFKEYKEKDEIIKYENCTIEITYSSTTAYITMSYKGVVRERVLVFDEESETVKEYY